MSKIMQTLKPAMIGKNRDVCILASQITAYIGKTFSDDNARFVFSKYALLDIPKVKTPTNLENTIIWQAMDALSGTGSIAGGVIQNVYDTISDQNVGFSQAFQSYPLNFEQLVLASKILSIKLMMRLFYLLHQKEYSGIG